MRILYSSFGVTQQSVCQPAWRVCLSRIDGGNNCGRRELSVLFQAVRDWQKHQKPMAAMLLREVSTVKIRAGRPSLHARRTGDAALYHRPKMKNKYDSVSVWLIAKRKRIMYVQGVSVCVCVKSARCFRTWLIISMTENKFFFWLYGIPMVWSKTVQLSFTKLEMTNVDFI